MKKLLTITLLLSLVAQIPFATAMDQTLKDPLIESTSDPETTDLENTPHHQVHFAANIAQSNEPHDINLSLVTNQEEKSIITRICEKNDALKKKIKELASNPKNKNKIRKMIWLSIASASLLNIAENSYGQDPVMLNLLAFIFAQTTSKLLETYDDPIRNSILTPFLCYALSIPLEAFDIKILYKNYKFITGWFYIAYLTGFSMAAYKTIDLMSWFAGKEEETQGAPLAHTQTSTSNANTSLATPNVHNELMQRIAALEKILLNQEGKPKTL